MPLPPPPADPRPTFADGAVTGSTCLACGHHSVRRGWRCEGCLGEVVDSSFGPVGVVWSSALVHIRVGDRTPPFALAYVDLEAPAGIGPRVLARLVPAVEVPPGTAVTVVDVGEGDCDGDLIVEVAGG